MLLILLLYSYQIKERSNAEQDSIFLTCTINTQQHTLRHSSFQSAITFFHSSQHGFRSGLSCDTQLALFDHNIISSLDLTIVLDALFSDFGKAFDKVPHQRLLLKLSQLNINTNVFIIGFAVFKPFANSLCMLI